MKLILIPLLMMLLLVQTFSSWMVVLQYQLNKNYIAKNFCVNKAKPKMHCNGKCQMMKRLAEEEKQNSSSTTNNIKKIKIEQLFFSDETNKPTMPSLTYVALCYNEEQPFPKHSSPVTSIFHPPSLG
jgi:hypothetical protein